MYSPLYIKKFETGLVQSRVESILPNDAFPILENAYVWRERIKKKQGCRLLGQLRRVFIDQSLGTSSASIWTINNIYSTLATPITPEATAIIEVGSVEIDIGGIIFTDNFNGNLTSTTPGNSGTINYRTAVVVLTHTAGIGVPTTISFNYYPGLPVMGVRNREGREINNEETIFFDTKYAYNYLSGFKEFIQGTTWTGSDSDFFWTTNYWVDSEQRKIFWATNFSGTAGDPIRYTNGIAWADFGPQIDASGNILAQSLCLIPFRGRLVAFNTYEGPNLTLSDNYTNRIRWAAIGNPFTTVNVPTSITSVNPNAWRDDIIGQGGFLDIPTSEDIVSVGFVRDNLVIYCERSTWQLRYTGRSISPFQVEKVNSELGAESTFSAIQFDSSLLGIGDKGVVNCDSYQSKLIDIKIPDLVFSFNNNNNAQKRVHGIRDFIQRLAYWTYPYQPIETPYEIKYPNRRLVYNYENDSWAIFTDSLTCLGTFQPLESSKWENNNGPYGWAAQDYSWIARPSKVPLIVSGNQQGYIHELDYQSGNEQSLTLHNVIGSSTTGDPITCVSYDHNLVTGQIIEIVDIPTDTYASSLNRRTFKVEIIDKNQFILYRYDFGVGFIYVISFGPGNYRGGGKIILRDNFKIVSKKFNFADYGQNIQIGYIDILLNHSQKSYITLNLYLDYNNNSPVNQLPENTWSQNFFESGITFSDPCFNTKIPLDPLDELDVLIDDDPVYLDTTKSWKRIFCPVRGAFITLEYTFNDEIMASDIGFLADIEIEAQILWLRKAGKQLPIGR